MKQFFNRLYRLLFCRRGFGVHSPFVYDLITNVIEEDREYYFYKAFHDTVRRAAKVKQSLRERERKLLFRLANRFRTYRMLIVGSDGAITAVYMLAFSSAARCLVVEPHVDSRTIEQKNASIDAVEFAADIDYDRVYDFAVIDLHFYNTLNINAIIAKMDNSGLIALCSIDAFPLLWQRLSAHGRVSVAIDLQNIGLLFLNPALPRKIYRCVIP